MRIEPVGRTRPRRDVVPIRPVARHTREEAEDELEQDRRAPAPPSPPPDDEPPSGHVDVRA